MANTPHDNVGEVLVLKDFSTPDVAFSLNATVASDGSVVLYDYKRTGSNHDSKIIVINEDEFEQLASYMGYIKEV